MSGKHEALPDPHASWFAANTSREVPPPAVPTQVARPWRATWRTVVQVGIPSAIILVGVTPEVLTIVLDGMGEHLQPEARAWLAGAAAVVTALAGTLARIAAIPRVNEALKAVHLSAR